MFPIPRISLQEPFFDLLLRSCYYLCPSLLNQINITFIYIIILDIMNEANDGSITFTFCQINWRLQSERPTTSGRSRQFMFAIIFITVGMILHGILKIYK